MKNKSISNKIKLVGVKRNFRTIDFYITMPGGERLYAFTKNYSEKVYEICKKGIRINDLITRKSRDKGMMNLVKYTNYIMPYLYEYYELAAVS